MDEWADTVLEQNALMFFLHSDEVTAELFALIARSELVLF